MKLSHLAILALLATAPLASAWAQPGPGPGGMGPGMGRGFAADPNTMPGWALMTPEERVVQHNKMMAANSYGECKAIQAEHHQVMVARAAEKGVTLPTSRQNGCDRMQQHGFFR